MGHAAQAEGPSGGRIPEQLLRWVQVAATYAGVPQTTALFPVYTANYDYGDLPDVGWKPELQWRRTFVPRGVARLVRRRRLRQVLRLARRRSCSGADPQGDQGDAARQCALRHGQPTSAPRSSPAADRRAVGGISEDRSSTWARRLRPTTTPARSDGRLPAVGISDALKTNKHIAIFQMFGPQAVQPNRYPTGRGAITIIDANRNSDAEPIDASTSTAISSTAATLPPRRIRLQPRRWTDIVIGIRMSADVHRGWIEVYLNQGEHRVQPVPLFGGKMRPRG